MPSLDFETEKAEFIAYYDGNAVRFEQAKETFLTLLRSLLAQGEHGASVMSGRIKDREESIKKFTRKYQGDLEKSETPYAIKDHISDLIGLRLVCLYKAEVIHRRGPWRSFEAVEYATLEWVDWFNNPRLLEPIGNIPPAEAEERYYAMLDEARMAA